MKKICILLLLVFLFPVPAQAWIHGTGCLGTDANGWTVYPSSHTMGSSAVGKTYYVSTTEGNDGTAVANDVTKPWLTIAAAITLMKSNAGGNNSRTDSWLLLKRGDVFQNQSVAGNFNSIRGIDCLHPMVISSYDRSQPDVPDPYGSFTVSGISCAGGTATVTTTSAHGWTNGQAYQVVLTKELPAGFNGLFAGTITGASTLTFPVTCPAASDTLQGIITLARPSIQPNTVSANSVCGPNDAGNGSDYLVYSGIDCYGYQRDPDNASFDKTSYLKTLQAYVTQSAITWNLIENTGARFTYGQTISAQPASHSPQLTGGTLIYRRNVQYYAFGNYINGWDTINAIENYAFYDNWNPNLIVGASVSVATGTPGVITWVSNPLISGTTCSQVKFTGGTLPPELTASTTYFAKNVVGDDFSVATSCAGTAINFTGSPSGVIAYWWGTSSGFAGIYPQGGPCTGGCNHSYYIQDSALSPIGFLNMTFRGNVLGFPAGSAVQGGGNMTGNVLFQGWSMLGSGKFGAIDRLSNYTNSYNGIFETGEMTTNPATAAISSSGLVLAGRQGTNTGTNNLIAYETAAAAGHGIGISPNDYNSYPVVSTVTGNVVCGMTTPINPVQGQPITFTISNGGTGISAIAATTQYNSPFCPVGQGGSPAIGGSGTSPAGLTISVNSSGAVSAVSTLQQVGGLGYQVGDIITSANTYIGGEGSGWSARVATVSALGNITSLDTLVEGSGYNTGVLVNTSGGTGTGALAIVSPGSVGCGSSCSIKAVCPFTGYGYTVNDILSPSIAHTIQPTITVATVVNNTVSGNTFKAANCNNLESATGSGGTGQPDSVPPPLTPSATPPTDVIGEYFHSLAYGYEYTVPTILVGTTTTYEQGYMHQASLQQKANWDTAMMATAVLNWARPQFGMVNP